MKVLINGGLGYIGSYLFDSLNKKHHVDIVDTCFYLTSSVEHLVRYAKKMPFSALTKKTLAKYDAIIHLAGYSSVPLCNGYPLEAIKDNVMNLLLLEKKLSKSQLLIYASSSCVYNTNDNTLCTESSDVHPSDVLSWTKGLVDFYISNYCSSSSRVGLRFGSVNGWSPNFRRDLCLNSMTCDALDHGIVNVTNPDCSRPITGLPDILSIVNALLDQPPSDSLLLNVSSFNTTFRELGRSIADMLNAKLDVVETDHPNTYSFTMSSEKAEQIIGRKFDCTIESLVNDILQHKNSLEYIPRK